MSYGLTGPRQEPRCKNTYGTKAMISVEVGVTSIRRKVFNEERNDDHLRINLDCLDKVREKASIRMTQYQ